MTRWFYSHKDSDSDSEIVVSAKDHIENWQTLCTFTSLPENPESTSIKSATSNSGKICISFDETVNVFEDENCSFLLFSIDIRSTVDCCCFVDAANVLIVASRNGDVYCFNYEGCVLFEKSIPVEKYSDDFTIVNVIVEAESKEIERHHSVLIICCNGSIFRITWHDVPGLKSKIQTSVHHLESVEYGKVSAAVVMPLKELSIAIVGDNLSVWSGNVTDSFCYSDFGLEHCVKVQMWKEKFLVCLSSDYKLSVICTKTLLSCAVWDEFSVQDFYIMNVGNNVHKECIVLLQQCKEFSQNSILVLSLPDFKMIHEVKISKMLWLIPVSSHVMCIERCTSINDVETLRIIKLSNCNPYERLKFLLRQYKFDDAENLAHQFDLDIEFVFKQKALFYVTTLHSQYDPPCFRNLICCLEKILDIQFIISFCLQHNTYHIEDMSDLLRYGLKRIQESKEHMSADSEKMCLELHSRLRNLETVSLVKENICHNTTKWKKVLHLDWAKTCFEFLGNGDAKKAAVIWSRHLQSLILSEEEIKQLFTSISPRMEQNDVFFWLQLLIPYLHQYAPDIIEDLVKWATNRTKLMENCEDQWPNSAIIFIKELLNLITDISKAMENRSFYSFGKHNEYLLSFLSSLCEIQLLKNNYGIQILLEEFLQEDKLEVAKSILKRVTQHDVDRIMNEYMNIFIEKHCLSLDAVVLYFIKKLLSVVDQHWIHLPVNYWEPIVVTCINYVQSVPDRIECILTVLNFATIPWSNTILTLAAVGRTLNHPRSYEINRIEEIVKKKLVFKKYNLEIDLLESSKYSMSVFLIRKIIMEAREEMLEDASIIAGDSLKLQAGMYTTCLHYYIAKEMCEEAIVVLESLDSKIFEICCKRMLCRIEVENSLPTLYQYIIVIYPFASRLCCDISIARDFEYVKNLYLLNLNFEYKIIFKDFICEDKRRSMLKLWIKSLTIDKNCTDIYLLCKNAKQIAQLCFFPSGDGLLEVFNHLPEGIFTSKRCQLEDVLNCEIVPFSRDKLCLSSKQSFMKMCGKRSIEYNYCKIMVNVFLSHPLSINDPWLHLLSWINRAVDVSGISEYGKAEKYGFPLLKIFHDCLGSAWKPEVVSFVQTIFNFLEENVSSEDVMSELQKLVEKLFQSNTPVILIALLNIAKFSLNLANCQNIDLIDNYLKQIIERLLSKFVCSQSCDIHFCSGLLFSLEETTAKDWLLKSVDEFRTRFQKLERIAKLGILYFSNRNINDQKHFNYLFDECLWVRHFRRCNISICEKSLVERKEEVMTKLLLASDVEMAEKFSKTFGIDFRRYMPECLERVILSWKPDFEIKENKDRKRELIMKNSEDDIADLCLSIAKRINKRDLKISLHNILQKINYYYYEMFFCVDILKSKILQEEYSSQLLLTFLKHYFRNSPMEQEERNAWFLKYENSHSLPAIAEWRLPFWPNDMEKVINPELTLNSYEQWLDVASCLNISSDLIRVIVLKQVLDIFEREKDKPAELDWGLQELNKSVICQIQTCAKGIINQELACSALYHMFRFAKHGAAKCQLAKLCVEFSKEWAHTVKTDRAKKTLVNITQSYLDLSTTNILYKYKLGISHYLNKISKPEVLVRELYYHPGIVKRSLCLEDDCPDVNAAVNEIAKLHVKVKWEDLFLNLLKEWLRPNVINDKFDDTVTVQGNLQTMLNYRLQENENFIRASYMLKKKNSSVLLETLLNVIFLDEKEECAMLKRNAMICIMETLSMDKFANLSGKTPENIRHNLQILEFISELNSNGYLMSVPQFAQCKKLELLMELLSSGNKNSGVLTLAAKIALKYSIFNPEIWELLLKCMIKRSMCEELEDVLGKLPANLPEIVEAWTFVIFRPFQSSDVPLSDDQRKSCLHSLNLLHKCTVTNRVNLLQLGQLCCQVGSPHWATLLLNFMNREQRNVLKKEIVGNISVNEIMEKLKDFDDVCLVSRAKSILSERQNDDL